MVDVGGGGSSLSSRGPRFLGSKVVTSSTIWESGKRLRVEDKLKFHHHDGVGPEATSVAITP